MLRFIFEKQSDGETSLPGADFFTLDVDVPEVQAALERSSVHEIRRVIGVEVLAKKVTDRSPRQAGIYVNCHHLLAC